MCYGTTAILQAFNEILRFSTDWFDENNQEIQKMLAETLQEMLKAIEQLKSEKTAGIDGNPP